MSDEKRIEELVPREGTRHAESSASGRELGQRGVPVPARDNGLSSFAAPVRDGEKRVPSAVRPDPQPSRPPDAGRAVAHASSPAPRADGGVIDDARARESRLAPMQHDILNIDEAAELLRVSIKTFNKVLHNQNMPARKIGREWKFSRQALIDWVGSGRSQEFYKESSDDDEDEREVEIRPQSSTPSERPKSRRTAGWQIEMD
jgi:excisionase family DNA binding protein